MTSIRYCANPCTTIYDGQRSRTQVDGDRAILCARCEDQLRRWLLAIPDNYALLPTFREPGSTEKNPDSKSTKASYAQAPIRLEVIDLLDQRRGLMWNGTAPAHDRRGALGTLQVHVERLRLERMLASTSAPLTVSEACNLLHRHRLWITEQDWAPLLYEDLKLLNRQLSDAVGDYRRPPVGKCQLVPEEAETACGGGLYPDQAGGVHCVRCGNTWSPEQLRFLGLTLGQAGASA